jgi:hypothetical protein
MESNNSILTTAFGATIVAALAIGAAPAAAAGQDDAVARGEAKLAKILEGRIAGEPQKCLADYRRDRLEIVDHVGFVYRDGKTIWVNRPQGATILDWSDLPVFRQYGSQLCRLDQVELRDRGAMMPGPVLVLGDFVPYTRPDKGG